MVMIFRISTILLVILFAVTESAGQDLLRFFLPGDPRDQLMGGNPFSRRYLGNDETGAYLRYDFRYDSYYKERRKDGANPNLAGASKSLSLLVPFSTGAHLALSAQSTDLGSTARNSATQTAEYRNSRKEFRILYDTPLSQTMRWNLSLGGTNASSGLMQDVGSGVSFLMPNGALSFNVDRISGSQQLNIAVSGLRGILPLDHQSLRTQIGLRGGTKDVTLHLTASQSVLSRLPAVVRGNDLQFSPNGFLRGFESGMEISLASSWSALLAAGGMFFEGRGDFAARGSQYASLKEIQYESTGITAGLMHETESGSVVVADLRWQHVHGSFDGYAESWPFVSLFDSPLSLRGNFRGAGAVRLLQAHAGTELPVTGWLRLGAGLSLLRMMPELRIESWQSQFFGLGQKAYQDRRLSVDRLDGGIVSAGARVHIGSIALDYSVVQFVPIYLKKRTLSGGAQSLITAPTAGSVIESSGGQFHKLTVEVGW